MPPKPKQIANPHPKQVPSTSSSSSSPSSGTAASSTVRHGRRRRWFHSKPTLLLLLILQPVTLLFAFVLLTEPCLNPNHFKPSLWDKRNYLQVLLHQDASTSPASQAEAKQRFVKASTKSLFGTLIIQAWFCARLMSYLQKAVGQETIILNALKSKSDKKDSGSSQLPAQEPPHVPPFIRQLETVSVSLLLGMPFVGIGIYLALVLLGVPIYEYKLQTLVLVCHLTLLIGLPLGHLLGFPNLDELTTSGKQDKPASSNTTSNATPIPATDAGETATSSTTPTPVQINTAKSWSNILNLNPTPSYLLPLFYPILGCLAGTLLGATTLTLDWGKNWQTYPFPLILASIFGLAAGNLVVGSFVIFG